MCAVAMIPLAISAVSALYSAKQQGDAASNQQAAIVANNNTQMASVLDQYRQANEGAGNDIATRARDAMVERGRLSAISGDAGVGGASSERLLQESQGNEGRDVSTIQQNLKNTDQQILNTARGINSTTQTRLSSVTKPSLIGTGLQIAGAAATTYAEQNKLKNKAQGVN